MKLDFCLSLDLHRGFRKMKEILEERLKDSRELYKTAKPSNAKRLEKTIRVLEARISKYYKKL